MTKAEFMKLRSGDYVYRTSDGWGGLVQYSVPSKWSSKAELSLKNSIRVFDYKKYPSRLKASEIDGWEILIASECTNALALAKYAINVGFDAAFDVRTLDSALRNRPML